MLLVMSNPALMVSEAAVSEATVSEAAVSEATVSEAAVSEAVESAVRSVQNTATFHSQTLGVGKCFHIFSSMFL